MEFNFDEQAKTGAAQPAPNDRENGRFALALSGGGFRASFFHIGVLAALADLGILHKIEVISGVSGGSIIAAYYYLKVKEKLEENWAAYSRKSPGDDGSTDVENEIKGGFREIVKDIESSFLLAVQNNIRSRVFFHPCKNFKMARSSRYSRSDRISELYDRYLYGGELVRMKDLKIPKQLDDYDPMEQNDSMIFKVPILKINATALNTGHNWTVEAKHMGEPPRDSKMEIAADKNMRLRRPPGWDQTAPDQINFQLSDAVAASACVPGLFHPMAVSNMYEDTLVDGKSEKITAQLVDGGVHDNLGIAAISTLTVKTTDNPGENGEEEYCSNIIVSDASGQMDDQADPSTNILKVLGRMNGILMDRVREEELFRLFEQCKKSPKRFALMHLRKKLPRREVKYLDENGNPGKNLSSATPYLDSPEDFGVPIDVQDYLSKIRTDLDSFTDLEAQSLMLDAYLMSVQEVKIRFGNITMDTPKDDWNFTTFKPIFDELIQKKPDGIPADAGKFNTRKYLRHLKHGSKTTFKAFYLSPYKAFACLLGIYVVPIVFLAWLFWDFLTGRISTFLSNQVMDLLPGLGILAAGFILSSISPFFRWLKRTLPVNTYKIILKFVTGAGKWSRIWTHMFSRFLWPTLGWLIVLFHLYVFDKFFKQSGKFQKFVRKDY